MCTFSRYIGRQIRFYRKQKGLTLEQLADMICKSKSSVSKYENGEVSIDAETLFDIASALQIPLSHLTDYPTPQANAEPLNINGFFFGTHTFYHYCSFFKRFYTSVLTLEQDGESIRPVFYFNVQDFQNYNDCGFLYRGEISASYTHINLHMINEINPADEINMTYINLFSNQMTTRGILSSVSEQKITPCATKCLLSKSPLRIDDSLKKQLLPTSEELKIFRSTGTFVLTRDFLS